MSLNKPVVTAAAKKVHVAPDAKNKPCKNVLIYGYCNKEDKGCVFNHGQDKTKQGFSPMASPDKRSLRVDSPDFTPASMILSRSLSPAPGLCSGASISPMPEGHLYSKSEQQVNNSTIVGDESNSGFSTSITNNLTSQLSHMDMSGHPFQPEVSETSTYTPVNQLLLNNDRGHDSDGYLTDTSSQHFSTVPAEGPFLDNHRVYYPMTLSTPSVAVPNAPLLYHMYMAPQPSSVQVGLNRTQKSIHHFFISDHLREELTQRNQELIKLPQRHQRNDQHQQHSRALPGSVHTYHTLLPFKQVQDKPAVDTISKTFGYVITHYRAVNSSGGMTYCLMRIENYRLANETAMSVVERWQKLRHPSIVHLHEAFTTKAFNDSSLVFVYDYHPGAISLYTKHFLQTPIGSANSRRRQVQQQSTEQIMWSYISQIASAIKAVHSSGLALRVLDASKILFTGKNRIHINTVGVADVLVYDAGANLALFQQEDLVKMGHLLLNLACNSPTAASNLGKSLDHITRRFSNEFKNMILFLLSAPSPMKTIDEAVAMTSSKLILEMDSLRSYEDVLEGELAKELENGRLFRLMCKLGFINERPEFELNPAWSETGDRYLLKLFRDYVFHQVDEHGHHVIDMAHVIACLNKLDVGADETIMLMSRDEQNCLIVSYKELKLCMESVFTELTRKRPM